MIKCNDWRASNWYNGYNVRQRKNMSADPVEHVVAEEVNPECVEGVFPRHVAE